MQSLRQLIAKLNIPVETLEKHSYTVDFTAQSLLILQKTASYIETLRDIPNSVASKGMIRKIARSGLNLQHLKLAYTREGRDGVISLLSEQFGGKPCVTKDKKILNAVANFMESSSN